ncbi:CD9 antigen-like isoform X2 [Biomphalaria glabrata]|uniref:Tetraspanin n=1 Tax=Biomphalaria glabrata TaxID=6526 RepID=A0A9W3BIJ3_BIOGL|nr:CD9 antigen-like isoform X2 [Biomphalaria glabrata]
MALGSCYTCVKYLMFAFNFIFWLLGCAILGVGIWLRVDENAASYLKDSHINYFHTAAYILISVGFVIMVVGFLGCCGAIRESQCMLASFFICLFVIFAVLLGCGIWAAVAKDQVKDTLEKFLEDGVNQYYKDENKRRYMDYIQTDFDCCGYNKGDLDYTEVPKVPKSCHRDYYTKPCTTALYNWAESKLIIIAGVAIGIAVVLILGMVFSMVLCCAIRDTVA